MRLVLISLLMIPLTLGCDGGEEKPAADTGVDADADDTGTPGPDYVHTFSVPADVPFEHTEAVVLRGEETWPMCEDCPEGLTVRMTSDDADALLLYSGTLAPGTYAFSLRLKHVLDAPTEYSTIDATITAE